GVHQISLLFPYTTLFRSGLTCVIRTAMLSRIVLSIAMATALVTAPVSLTARSCILSSAPIQQACKPGCCANKTCCATSSEHKSRSEEHTSELQSRVDLVC